MTERETGSFWNIREIDEEFANLWRAYGKSLEERRVLDDATRRLVAIGQCVTLGLGSQLRDEVQRAVGGGCTPIREVLEVGLQASLYVGLPQAVEGLRVIVDVLVASGIELGERSGAASDADADDASGVDWALVSDAERLPMRRLMEKYGESGIATGLRLTPTQHPWWISFLDRMDEDFARAWLELCFVGMYRRGVLDHRTRTLVMVGNCLALSDMEQARNHMRNAMILGSSKEEVREVLFQSTRYIGMPRALGGVRILEGLVREQETI